MVAVAVIYLIPSLHRIL